mmetsp:Transcript_16793/g.37247  ORF Transcript_16793/g.37247 Transcript_16793/m.37247 type:complete len:170 (+) Transcript_16793:121-630(+)
MVLGYNTIKDALSGPPTIDGPSQLPDYFPVEPRGCEKHSARLFKCLAGEATDKAREMEKAGLHRVWYPDVKATPGDENAARRVKEAEEAAAAAGGGAAAAANKAAPAAAEDRLPTRDDVPLDECRTLIAYYKRCCDRELKKKQNCLLTEPYRVQEEYRYQKQEAQQQKT